MKSLQLNVSGDAEVRLDRQMRAAGFDDLGAYVEALLKADRRRLAQDHLELELLRGIESGPSAPLDDEAWARITREFERRRNEHRESDSRR